MATESMHNIIPVISGKGGVGKSTVAVNLAISLANSGAKVALIDSDFYGPSVPILMGGGLVRTDHENRLIPAERYGVKYVSLGFFLQNPDDAVMWRGPMFNKALQQLFEDVNWGSVDFCIIDMPPGTGDAQISLSQIVQLTGAVVVTTPQEVALADVRKAINMLEKVNVPILGLVENMSYFETPDGSRHEIFGSGGGAEIAKKFNIPLLGALPIDTSIREGGDEGVPVATDKDSLPAKEFLKIADKLLEIVDSKQQAQEQPVVMN